MARDALTAIRPSVLVHIDQNNPYASPQIPADAAPTPLDELYESRGCWRDGRMVVTTVQGRLPPRCVKEGDPASEQESIRLTWYPPWAMVFLLLGPLFFLPLYFCGRRIDVAIPTGRAWQRRKARRVLICGVIGLASILTGIIGVAIAQTPGWPENIGGGLAVVAGLAFIGALLAGVDTASPPLRITYADQRFVWLKGAGEAFLEALPSWPGGR